MRLCGIFFLSFLRVSRPIIINCEELSCEELSVCIRLPSQSADR